MSIMKHFIKKQSVNIPKKILPAAIEINEDIINKFKFKKIILFKYILVNPLQYLF